ncbi:hypothetical protein ACQP1G_19860 [Nocardia sp. CA-107356]|uniref:hypothetical protein n=1 Tax=Nocardia sp. CA-107356 TaxID=3239972 RepID=UPI003D906625
MLQQLARRVRRAFEEFAETHAARDLKAGRPIDDAVEAFETTDRTAPAPSPQAMTHSPRTHTVNFISSIIRLPTAN